MHMGTHPLLLQRLILSSCTLPCPCQGLGARYLHIYGNGTMVLYGAEIPQCVVMVIPPGGSFPTDGSLANFRLEIIRGDLSLRASSTLGHNYTVMELGPGIISGNRLSPSTEILTQCPSDPDFDDSTPVDILLSPGEPTPPLNKVGGLFSHLTPQQGAN